MSDNEPNIEYESEQIICPSCGLSIDVNDAFCPKCEAPISLISNVDPIQSIRTEGFILTRATESKPKTIVLLGIWMLFLPALIGGILVPANVVFEGSGSGFSGFVFFWVGIGLAILSLTVLFKVTRNYFKADLPQKSDNGDS